MKKHTQNSDRCISTFVVPAKAGTHPKPWIPAFAGMTVGVILLGAGCANQSAQLTTQATSVPAQEQTQTNPPQDTSVFIAPSSTPVQASSTTSVTTAPKPFKPIPMPTTFPGILPAEQIAKRVTITTSAGTIVVELDPKKGPRAASNFYTLAKAGFYDGVIFHRVIPGFMIQGGDPQGLGIGGPGYKFDNDPVTDLPTKTITIQGQSITAPVYEAGILAMANAGRDTNGSQFFIMAGDYPLPPDYSIFGKVVSGMDVVQKIVNAPRDPRNDRPTNPVSMTTVRVEE